MATATAKKRSTKGAKSAKGNQAAWTCLRYHQAALHEPICPHCRDLDDESLRPGLTHDEAMLAHALAHSADARKQWERLAARPCGDSGVAALIGAVLRSEANTCAATPWGPIAWRSAPEPALWLQSEDCFAERRPADYEGAALVAAARKLFAISQPPAAESNEADQKPAKTIGKREKPRTSERQRTADNGRPKANGQPAEAAWSLIDLAAISRFPLNPRGDEDFDEASLRALGESLRRRQIEPCVVRLAPRNVRGYELIAGERRYRAAQLVGLKTLRCEVIECDDAEAVRLCGEENERRANWSDLARARWFRALKSTGGLARKEIAKLAGCSESQVANTVGLLELPETWQARIISREIAPTVARALIPWAKKRPQVLDAVAKELGLAGSGGKAHRIDRDAPITTREMDNAIREVLRRLTRPMHRDSYRGDGVQFAINDKVKEQLDCEKLQVYSYSGPVLRAWNTSEWNRKQKEAKKRATEKAKKEGKAPAKRGGYQPPPPPPVDIYPPPVDIYDLKRAVAAWQGTVLAERLTPRHKHLARKIGWYLLWTSRGAQADAFRLLEADLGRTPKTKRPRWFHPADEAVWGLIQAVPDAKWEETVESLARRLLADEGREGDDEPRATLEAQPLLAIGRIVGIDWLSEWRPTEAMLSPYRSLARLRKFPRAPQHLAERATIKALLADWEEGFVPEAIAELLGRPQPARKKAKQKAAKKS